MKKILLSFIVVLMGTSVVSPSLVAQATKDSVRAPRPIELQDILAWKRIQSATVSPNGEWLAFRLAPNEGDGEVVVRSTSSSKELRYPAGESQSFGDASIVFSDDSKWLAFVVYPNAKEAKKAKKDKKPLYNKLALVNLATEKKVEFEKIKSFAFAGEASTWIAMQRDAGESQEKEKEKWSGSDLILRELSSGSQLNIGNVSEFRFDKKGNWLAWTVDAQDKSGNGLQFRNVSTGAVYPLDSDSANYKGLTWTEKGDGLAVLKGREEKGFEDKFYSLLGFRDFSRSQPEKVVYEPNKDTTFPSGMTISPSRNPQWDEDLTLLLFGIHEPKKKEDKKEEGKGAAADSTKKADDADKADLVIWHWLDPRLQSQQQVEETRDKDFSYLCVYRVKDERFIRIADDSVRNFTAAPKQKWAIGYDNHRYELEGNLDGRRYKDVYISDLKTGTRTLAVKQNRWSYDASPDGTHFLYYDAGHFYTHDMGTSRSYNITQQVPTVFYNQEDDHNVIKPPTRVIGWVKDGVSVLISDGWDVWNVPVRGGTGKNLTVNGRAEKIRYQTRFRLDPDEKGIDLSEPVYFSTYGEWTKKGGICRIDKGRPGVKNLLWDDAAFGGLMKAKKADKYFYTRQTFREFPDYYASDYTLQQPQRLTDAMPEQMNFLWSSGSRLITYISAKGDTLQAALYLPASYEAGKSYPTIVYIYEKLSSNLNLYFTPSASGFNKSVYTSNGYAVLMPDIVYKLNDPGMSAVWCVLSALDSAIATGIVDRSKVAIHGHSWGGYQTAFLVTQTKAFRAAVAGAPLTDMISMYSSIYWNTGSANQPIFESSQGRFTGGYWENVEAYTRNSPVYFARNVTTPLLLLHNDKDGAVDWNQGIEYFNTLRRLKKAVVLLQYKGENHGLREPANQKDYTVRMHEFFDHHLMGKTAPKWLEEGVPLLKLKEHLEERSVGKPKVAGK